MKYSTYRFTLDLQKHQSQMSITAFKYDTAVSLHISLTDGGRPYYIENGCYAVFYGKRGDKEPLIHPCSIKDNTEIIYKFDETTAAKCGVVECQICVYDSANYDESNLIATARFDISVAERVVKGEDVEIDGKSPTQALDELFLSEKRREDAEYNREKVFETMKSWDTVIVKKMIDEGKTLNELLANASGKVYVNIPETLEISDEVIEVNSNIKLLEFNPLCILKATHTNGLTIRGFGERSSLYDYCQIIRGANSSWIEGGISDTNYYIDNFLGGVEHCHGNGWLIKNSENISHCRILGLSDCKKITHCTCAFGDYEEMKAENCSIIDELVLDAIIAPKFVGCTNISNIIGDVYHENSADPKPLTFDNCAYISNVKVQNITSTESFEVKPVYTNCTFVDPYTCDGFLSEDEKGKVRKLTDDGKFEFIEAVEKAEFDSELTKIVGRITDADNRLKSVETFFDTAEDGSLDGAIDTLIEIQDYINKDGVAASKLTEQVNTNKQDIAELKEDVEIITHDLSDANERLETVEKTLEEGVGGVSSWNDLADKPDFAKVATTGSYDDLTDKPFGIETTEGIITFDGDYTKYEYVDMGTEVYVRVSDKVLTVDEVTGATIRVVEPSTGAFEDIIADNLMSLDEMAAQTGVNVYGCTITIVSSIENGSTGIYSIGGDVSALHALGFPLAKEGTYFTFGTENDFYVEYISCLSGSVETVKQIDKKYLPDTSEWDLVITAEMLKENILNDLLADARGKVYVKGLGNLADNVDENGIKTIIVPAAVKFIEFAPSVIFTSIIKILAKGTDDDCQVIKGATNKANGTGQSVSTVNACTIEGFKGGVEHCHGAGWNITNCNNINHCTIVKLSSCNDISHCSVLDNITTEVKAFISNCTNIEGLTSPNIGTVRNGIQFEDCLFIRDVVINNKTYFYRCSYIQNIYNPDGKMMTYGAECKFVDPYTCDGFLADEDVGKIQVLTKDGTFSAVAI